MLCKSCGLLKRLSEFSKHPGMKTGRLNYCKPCIQKKSQSFPSRQSIVRSEQYQLQLLRQGKTPFVHPTKEEKRAKARIRSRNWQRKQKGTPLDAPIRDDAGRSPEYYRARHTALEMKRTAAKKQRTLPWLSQAQLAEIEEMYHFAKVMEHITGRKYHVDHIEPLLGKDVSGLHVPWNLRVIPAVDNIAKGNRRIANG